jgi:hypothetical protein
MMMAFVVTTTMPTLSHAATSMDAGQKIVKAEHVKKHKCCHEVAHKVDAKKIASDNAPCPMEKKSCCDKGSCKCLGNSCGSAKVLGFQSLNFLPVMTKGKFYASEDGMASSLQDRLKRPPRA